MSLSLPCADGSSLSNGVEFVLIMLTVIVQLYICNCNIRSPPRIRQIFNAPGLAAHLLLHEGSLVFILPDIRRIGIASHCIALHRINLWHFTGASWIRCLSGTLHLVILLRRTLLPCYFICRREPTQRPHDSIFMNTDFLLRQTGLPIRPRITSCLSEHLPTVRML